MRAGAVSGGAPSEGGGEVPELPVWRPLHPKDLHPHPAAGEEGKRERGKLFRLGFEEAQKRDEKVFWNL